MGKLTTITVPGAIPEKEPGRAALKNKKGKRFLAGVSVEQDGPSGLDPTRYGDWERKGRCIDF